jgi:hypothetical protein
MCCRSAAPAADLEGGLDANLMAHGIAPSTSIDGSARLVLNALQDYSAIECDVFLRFAATWLGVDDIDCRQSL